MKQQTAERHLSLGIICNKITIVLFAVLLSLGFSISAYSCVTVSQSFYCHEASPRTDNTCSFSVSICGWASPQLHLHCDSGHHITTVRKSSSGNIYAFWHLSGNASDDWESWVASNKSVTASRMTVTYGCAYGSWLH